MRTRETQTPYRTEPGDELLTTAEAAALLRVHPATVQRLAREGKLRAIRAGGAGTGGRRGTALRFRREDLLAHADQDATREAAAPAEATVALSPRTAARLAAQARAAGTDPDTLLQEWLTDFEETAAALQEGLDAVRAGNTIALEDHLAREHARRRRRDSGGHGEAAPDPAANAGA